MVLMDLKIIFYGKILQEFGLNLRATVMKVWVQFQQNGKANAKRVKNLALKTATSKSDP